MEYLNSYPFTLGFLNEVLVDITNSDVAIYRECYARGGSKPEVPFNPLLIASRIHEQHDIGEEEWQAGLDLLAKEYLKGEGKKAVVRE